MLNWIDQYTLLWKSIERLRSYSRRYFSHENCPIAPLKRIVKNFWSFLCFRLSSWIDRYIVCENRFIGGNVILGGGYLSQKVSLVAPLAWNLEFFSIFDFFSPCEPEWIGMLIVKIGRTVKTLFKRGVIDRKCSLAPLEWIFEIFYDFVLFPLFCWID
jgi:hypothetical protein